jgi:sigma-B regulation protein RsbU (phosphoserine phosphatase)
MVAMNVAQYLNPEVEGCVFRQAQGRREVLDAASAVAELNRRICAQETADKYLTCVYGVLELRTGRLQVVRAGHPVPMVVHADGKCEVIAEEGDVPVALFADAQYTNHELQLRPGSRLVVFSDGITECDDPVGEAYGEERLRRYFTSRADQPLQQVTAEFGLEIQAWRGFPTQTFQDDISLMVVEFGPRPERAANPP